MIEGRIHKLSRKDASFGISSIRPGFGGTSGQEARSGPLSFLIWGVNAVTVVIAKFVFGSFMLPLFLRELTRYLLCSSTLKNSTAFNIKVIS